MGPTQALCQIPAGPQLRGERMPGPGHLALCVTLSRLARFNADQLFETHGDLRGCGCFHTWDPMLRRNGPISIYLNGMPW